MSRQLESSNQVEIGSAGRADQDEFNWNLSGLQNGWNLISLKTSEAGKMGSPDLSAINWFRIYHRKTGNITTRLDGVQLIDPGVGPVYTLIVNSGSGGGSYFEAEELSITANPGFNGLVFDHWVIESGSPLISDSSERSTTLIMGAGPAIVSATYTEPVSVKGIKSKTAAVKVYPNPASSEFSLALTLEMRSEISISLLDLSGREVGHGLSGLHLNPGFSLIKFPVPDVKPGAYILRSDIEGKVYTELVVIQ